MTVTAEQIAAWQAEHKHITVREVQAPDGTRETFVFKFPSRGQCKMWRAATNAQDEEAQENLVIGMCVSHQPEEFKAYLDKPGNGLAADVLAKALTPWIIPKVNEQGKG